MYAKSGPSHPGILWAAQGLHLLLAMGTAPLGGRSSWKGTVVQGKWKMLSEGVAHTYSR